VKFPDSVEDVEKLGLDFLEHERGIEDYDHPAFTDKRYLKEKKAITDIAFEYKLSHQRIPSIEYSEE
jgi:hypothetical protein